MVLANHFEVDLTGLESAHFLLEKWYLLAVVDYNRIGKPLQQRYVNEQRLERY